MMVSGLQVQTQSTTRREILKFLKMEGPTQAAKIARRLNLTAMAVRQHLYELQEQDIVAAEERPIPLGRPAKYWRLTRKADRLFPEAYAELSVALIDAVGNAFGEGGLNQILEARYETQLTQYRQKIPASLPLKEKLKRLADIRTKEGYMAVVKPESSGSFLLIENHCPICAAASVCKGFCSTEMDLFRSVLGPAMAVERVEHIISGQRRCVYRIHKEAKPRQPRASNVAGGE